MGFVFGVGWNWVQMNVWREETAAWPVANPVLTCASVSDAGSPSNFVADPFLYIQVIVSVRYLILGFLFSFFFSSFVFCLFVACIMVLSVSIIRSILPRMPKFHAYVCAITLSLLLLRILFFFPCFTSCLAMHV